VGNATADAPARICQHYLIRIRVICELALNYDAQAAKLKEHVRPVPPMHVDRLGIRGDAKAGDQDRELGVYDLFTITLFRHSLLALPRRIINIT
jgi:hypothetical protein